LLLSYRRSLKDNVNKSKFVREIAAYLIDSGRTGDLEPLLRDMAKQRVLAGIVEVTAFSAHSLAASVISDIHSEAKKLYPQAKRIIINERHDPDLIGGVRLEFPDYQLDLSIRSQLNRFRTLTTAERTV
jgi:F0F1-type ATP synthase delta subunit